LFLFFWLPCYPSMTDANESTISPRIATPLFPGGLTNAEVFWFNHYKWLEQNDYRLRRRYTPDWVPSWEASKKKDWAEAEDGTLYIYASIMDATRISDGAFVMLKIVEKSVHPHEADIGAFFSSEPLASDPANHCVPIQHVLQVPDDADKIILVMPLLCRYDKPRFDTFGEVVEFFRQIFEGLQFMHKHYVAHRDCVHLNVMMDGSPLYPVPYHPVRTYMKRDYSGRVRHLTRTQRPVKYYLTDFGLSRRYNPDQGPPLEDPIWGADKTVPEFQKSSDPCDPFPTDVYYLGNLIRENFLRGSEFTSAKLGFEFMQTLVDDMVQDDPKKRPTMDEVVGRFDDIVHGLSNWKLRSRVAKKNDDFGFFYAIKHWPRRLSFILKRTPAIPTP